MNPEPEDMLWNRLSKALFQVRRLKDERVFTAGVMAELRERETAESSWKLFARWALPALALSMGGLLLSVWYASEPDTVVAEALLQDNGNSTETETWLVNAPDEDEILGTVVTI